MRGAVVWWDTGSELYPTGELQAVAAAAAPACLVEFFEDDQAGGSQDGDGACCGVFGDADPRRDVPHPDSRRPPLLVWVRGQGHVFQRSPRQRADTAPPSPAVGMEDQGDLV
jgi:hypothetical protein